MPRSPNISRGPKQAGSLSISRNTFRQIDELIQDTAYSARHQKSNIDLLIRYMALVVKGRTQYYSGGPESSVWGRSDPALAFRIPVQRITGVYFKSWKHKRLAMGAWMVYNEDKAAAIIEYNLFANSRGKPRPILRMSTIDMLRFIQTTGADHYLSDSVMRPRRDQAGRFRSFQARVAGLELSGGRI